MSRFLTRLRIEELDYDGSADSRGSFRLLGDLIYESDTLATLTGGTGLIKVPEGFITDFASVPRIPVAFLLTGDTARRAAVVHDFLYWEPHQVERSVADDIFLEAVLTGGDPPWRAKLMWAGVRLGGGDSYDAPGQTQPAHVAAVIASGELIAP